LHIAILTKTLPPFICGIGDNSVMLGNAIRERGHTVTLIAGSGDSGENRCIIKDFWLYSAKKKLTQKIEDLGVDYLILQYTPLMYAINGRYQNYSLANFWINCAARWKTTLIVHENYFVAWWYPPSWFKGPLELHLLKRLMKNSNNVFTPSEVHLEEMKKKKGLNAFLLPNGSNLNLKLIDRKKMRIDQNIKSNEIILTLFGGGESLRKMSNYVNNVDLLLAKNKITVRWLFLGGVKDEWFKLKQPSISPGYLTQEELSAWLQLTDIFLMPHLYGVAIKRSTLMAAMQHGLPVVGTKGRITDQILSNANGVLISPMPGMQEFSNNVLKLCKFENMRKDLGFNNQLFFKQNFTWSEIADYFLKVAT